MVKVSQDNLNNYDQLLKINRDRNQGEKLRTRIDMKRSERLRQGAAAQVYSDVDTAYAAVLLSCQHGGMALIDFLNAKNDYRAVQWSCLNSIGAYLTAAAQLNLAAGREVIQ